MREPNPPAAKQNRKKQKNSFSFFIFLYVMGRNLSTLLSRGSENLKATSTNWVANL
jgi:hypothetical protein